MVIRRGDIWWVDLPEPKGSMPGFRHPMLIIQQDSFNQANINTVIGVVITTNLRLGQMPGNVILKARQSGLLVEAVVNITQIVTANKSDLLEYVETLPERKMEQVENSLRLVLSL